VEVRLLSSAPSICHFVKNFTIEKYYENYPNFANP